MTRCGVGVDPYSQSRNRIACLRLAGTAAEYSTRAVPPKKPQEGEVVAVDAGGRRDDGERIPMDIKSGDRILFGAWSGSEIKLDGEDLLIMTESDVLGILT